MDGLKAHIDRLEQQHKHSVDQISLAELDAKRNHLELLESRNADKEVMFSRQKSHDFRYKPGRHLAWLLADIADPRGWGKCAPLLAL